MEPVYCWNGDGRLAVGEATIGVMDDGEGDVDEVVVLLCGVCLTGE